MTCEKEQRMGWGKKCSSTLLRTVLAVARNSCNGTSLPWPWPLAIDPVVCERVTLKVSVFVTVALLEQFQKRIAEGWVHSNTLSWVVTSDVMSCTQSITCTVKRAEKLDPCISTSFP